MSLNPLIETILQEYRPFFKNHFEKYRNHVYRVYLICREQDASPEHENRYAIAAAFHDMGIWTNNTFDYLEPSISLAKAYLEKINKPGWFAEISLMIGMHHKISPYTGDYAVTVETFRKADWFDLSKGLIRLGLNRKKIRELTRPFPSKKFFRFLLGKTVANFFRHPLRPLPMFKR